MGSIKKVSKINNLLIKDIADYVNATSDEPKKLLMRDYIFEALANHNLIRAEDGVYTYESIEVKITNNINKDWILV